MAFLAPLAISLLGLAGAVVALHLTGRRGRRVGVASARLWRGLGAPPRGPAQARRRLRSLLLLLDIAAVACLALAIARPSLLAGPARNVVILLDASASMQATDVWPSRFAAARRQALDLVAGLRSGDAAAVVRVGATATRIGAADPGRGGLAAAIAAAQPGDGAADFAGAAALAAALLDPARGDEVVVLSDGGATGAELAGLPAAVRYRTIGLSDDNQGITGLTVAPAAAPGGRAGGRARIANFAGQPVEAPILALVDGSPFDSRRVALPARGWVDLDLSLPGDARLLELRLERPDALALDNRAYAWLAAPDPVDVLLVSDSPTYLRRALALAPGVRLRVLSPDGYSPGDAAAVVVLDGLLPERLPAGNLLLVDPPAPGEAGDASLGLAASGALADPPVVGVAAGDPLLAGVDLTGLVVRRARRLRPPDWARAVVEAPGGPLLLRGVVGSRRVVALAFGLSDSDLAFQPAFPLLIANAVDYLRPAPRAPTGPPDAVLGLDLPGSWGEPAAAGPRGPVAARRLATGPTLLPLGGPGAYRLTARAPSGRPADVTATVSLPDAGESDIAPRSPPPDRPGPPAHPAASGYVEGWWPLGLLGFLVLLGEWWWYHRGRGLPVPRSAADRREGGGALGGRRSLQRP